MIKLADLIADEAAFASLMQGLLCQYFCVGGRACMASPENDQCFCQEGGIIIAEALHQYANSPGAAPVCGPMRRRGRARPELVKG